MDIKLAGFNIETDHMDKLHEIDKELLTPEIFSSAYARISRSKKSVTELRSDARSDVEKARKSNQKIIFGMGHHSVAEHAVFNFDLIDLSRLALESIERFRLVSYTEKSQRYVTLKGDYLIPEDFEDNELRNDYIEIIELQNRTYESLFTKLKDFIYSEHTELAAERSNKSLLDGWAKEDARYILSLATLGQVGMTINARNLEHLFRHFSLSTLEEVRNSGKKIYELVKDVAPSIILFPESSEFDKQLHRGIKLKLEDTDRSDLSTDPVIIDHDVNGDDRILASFLSISNSISYSVSLERVSEMSDKKKRKIYLDMFKNMEFFDTPPRNFELADITFQTLVSASNFAQLKRHRMASLLQGGYDPVHGNTIPENIKRIGMENEFLSIIRDTNSVYSRLKDQYGDSADYILTNSHRRNVIMKMNLREAFHFIRLRSDEHAQWDIKDLSDKLLEKIIELFPLSAMLLCGKDSFVSKFENIYNKKPKINI